MDSFGHFQNMAKDLSHERKRLLEFRQKRKKKNIFKNICLLLIAKNTSVFSAFKQTIDTYSEIKKTAYAFQVSNNNLLRHCKTIKCCQPRQQQWHNKQTAIGMQYLACSILAS